MKNDYVSTSTTDAPEATKVAGADVKDEATKTDEVKTEESGETAEIKAEDAIEAEQESESEITDEADEETEQKKEEKAKPKKKGGFQRKLESKDREIEFLREQLARQTQPQPKNESEVKVEAKSDKPKADDFDSQADYLEALTDWKVEQNIKAAEAKRQDAEKLKDHVEAINGFQKKTAEFSKTVDDFDDALSEVDDIPLSTYLQDAIITSDLGPEIMYQLAKNPEEYKRINSLPQFLVAKEIGKLEAKLSKPESKPEVKTKTAAPPPPKPVGTKSPGKVIKDPSEMSGDEYIAWKKSRK